MKTLVMILFVVYMFFFIIGTYLQLAVVAGAGEITVLDPILAAVAALILFIVAGLIFAIFRIESKIIINIPIVIAFTFLGISAAGAVLMGGA